MSNEELREKYEEMHKQGVSAWFSDGREERETILKMGEPWEKLYVLEIGCGEGDLVRKIAKRTGTLAIGCDYSSHAIRCAELKGKLFNSNTVFFSCDYREMANVLNQDIFNEDKTIWKKFTRLDRLIMQGVLEHLDDPFTELKWMMDNLLGEHGDVITSSPCFLNPRGIVWMTLDMLGAVMSKTDLHFLNPWNFADFCNRYGYQMEIASCDNSWGNGEDMIADLKQRIPLALRDGKIPYSQEKLERYFSWMTDMIYQFVRHGDKATNMTPLGTGATMVYRISK